MEGLIVLLIVAVSLLPILILIMVSSVNKRVKSVEQSLKQLANEIGSQPERRGTPVAESKPIDRPVDRPLELKPKPKPEPAPARFGKRHIATTQKAVPVPKEVPVEKDPPRRKKASFKERNPDLERFIGVNLISKIGIVIFVIGMGFLVKLGIDNGVITEPMRVGIGVLIGGGLIGLAHRLRKSFASFSSILIGGALSVLYFSIGIGFHEYAIFSQTAAFAMMVGITAFSVLLSVAYDRKVLAVLAMLGGFGTPFFVSTGEGNYIALLTYVLILDLGMLTLAMFKKWNVINYLTYGFSCLLIGGVYGSQFLGNEAAVRMPLLLFATAFFVVFFLTNVVYNVRNKHAFKFPELSMLITNSGLYFALGLALLADYHGGLYSGMFTTALALFNLVFGVALYKRQGIDKNLLFLIIGMVLTFVTLIAPIQLEGNYITLFWAAEGVLLLWLGHKSGIQLMKAVAMVLGALTLVSLAMDWNNYYADVDYQQPLMVVLNKAVLVGAVVATGLLIAMRRTPDKSEIQLYQLTLVWRKLYAQVALAVVAYLAVSLEFNYQLVRFEIDEPTRWLSLGAFNYLYILTCAALAKFNKGQLLHKAVRLMSLVGIGLYMSVYLIQTQHARDLLLEGDALAYFLHFALLVQVAVVITWFVRWVKHQHGLRSHWGRITLWMLSIVSVFIMTTEAMHLSIIIQGADVPHHLSSTNALKSVIPVVWAVSALGLMLSGMNWRLKPLRLASLVLFSVTIVKLFVYDLQGNSTGKIISFTVLGAILLVISFLYQKLKFIIQDDEAKLDQ